MFFEFGLAFAHTWQSIIGLHPIICLGISSDAIFLYIQTDILNIYRPLRLEFLLANFVGCDHFILIAVDIMGFEWVTHHFLGSLLNLLLLLFFFILAVLLNLFGFCSSFEINIIEAVADSLFILSFVNIVRYLSVTKA